tara:strand:+ start:5298 stop:5732 length:435 start_codon:yes stop_codon:yes gene_type:complete
LEKKVSEENTPDTTIDEHTSPELQAIGFEVVFAKTVPFTKAQDCVGAFYAAWATDSEKPVSSDIPFGVNISLSMTWDGTVPDLDEKCHVLHTAQALPVEEGADCRDIATACNHWIGRFMSTYLQDIPLDEPSGTQNPADDADNT